MISDAIHSVSDVFSTIIVMIGERGGERSGSGTPLRSRPNGMYSCNRACYCLVYNRYWSWNNRRQKKFSAAITEIWLCPGR